MRTSNGRACYTDCAAPTFSCGCSVILHMPDKINNCIKGLVVTTARSPNTTCESRQQLIHHYAPLQFISVNTHNTQQDRRPASVCLSIPCIRHAGMLTSLCTIANVCLGPPPSLPCHIVSAGSVCVCVHASKRPAWFEYDFFVCTLKQIADCSTARWYSKTVFVLFSAFCQNKWCGRN